jgi:hypothetical protein
MLRINKFDTPWSFTIHQNLDGYEIEYINLSEICQGGPEIGDLKINGSIILSYRFGGPFIKYGSNLILPVLISNFWSRKFKLAKIDLLSKQITVFGKSKDLIFLDRIEDDNIYVFDGKNKNISSKFFKL